jgi:hypothetical protein
MKIFDRLVAITNLLVLIGLLIFVISMNKKIDKQESYNTNRVESLMKDSVKMHNWYENAWETHILKQ